MRNTIGYMTLAIMAGFLLTAAPAMAQAPNTISYQGRLTQPDGVTPITTEVTVLFSIYPVESGGTALWSTTLTFTPEPTGVFTRELGPIPANVFDGNKRYLGIKVGADAEMTPRQLLTAAPYSFSTAQIADNSVTAAKLVTGAVGSGQLANDAVTTAKIAAGAVGNTDIAADAVTTDKIAAGAVANADIAADAVTTEKIAAGAVGNADLAADAVTTEKIATGAVGSTDLAGNSVTTSNIVDGTITNADINASAAIAFSKITGGPGVEFLSIGSYTNLPTTLTNLGMITVSCPAPGYVVVMLTGSAVFFGDHTTADVGIGTTSSAFLYSVGLGRLDGSATLRWYEPYSAIYVYPVAAAGSYNFYALATKSSTFGTNSINLTNLYLTAIFIPNRY